MREITDRIESAFLRNERTVWIRPPRNPAVRTLTIFLDGELYRERVQAVAVLNRLRGVIADSWFVFVSSAGAEARWIECPCHPPFARFIVKELLPWLKARHIPSPPVRKILVGLSYTGLAAAYVAKRCPGVFQRVISQSGSFWWNDGALIEEYRRIRNPLRTAFYLDVGTREIQSHVCHRPDVIQRMSQLDGVRRFRDQLLRHGNRVEYVEYNGGHEFSAWKKTLPHALKWALSRRTG